MWFGERRANKRLLERIEGLEKAVEGLESRSKLLRNEWEDVFDRMNRVMGRLNARIRKAGAENEPPVDDATGPKGVEPPEQLTGTHATLSRMRGRTQHVLSR